MEERGSYSHGGPSSTLDVGAKVWVPSVTQRSSIEVGEDGTLNKEEVEDRTTTNAEGEKKMNSAAVIGFKATILDHEAGDSSIDVASDISHVQQHETEESSAVSEVPISAEAEAMEEPAANLGEDGSSQSSCLPEFPSVSPYRYTRAQLLYLRPEDDTTNLQQHNTSVRRNISFESPKQSVKSSSLPMEGRRIKENDQPHKYLGGGGDERQYHERLRLRNNSGGVKLNGGEQQLYDCNVEEKRFGKGTFDHCQQQNRYGIGKENQGITNNNSLQLHSTSLAAQCSDDCESLHVTEDRWKSRSRNRAEGSSRGDVAQLSVSILNKMTLEKFEKLTAQLVALPFEGEREVMSVIALLVLKAQAEPHFASMYSELCLRLSRSRLGGVMPKQFKTMLLEKCQEEFQKDRSAILKAIQEDGSLNEEDRNIKIAKEKRHHNGHMRFVGELYKVGLVKERVVHYSIEDLIHEGYQGDEEDIESMCKLLATVGAQLETESLSNPKYAKKVPRYFKAIKKMSEDSSLSSRICFMLKDLIEMKDAGWVVRQEAEKAKTLVELYDNIAKEEMAKGSQRQGRDRNRSSLPNVKGRHGGLQDQQKSSLPMRQSSYATPPDSNKNDGWEVVGKSARGKKVMPNQQEVASSWNSGGGRSAGRPLLSSHSLLSARQGYSNDTTKTFSGLAVNDDKQYKDKRNSKKDKDRYQRISKFEKTKEKPSKTASPRRTPPRAFTSDEVKKMKLNTQDSCKKFKNAVEELNVAGDIDEAMHCMIELASPEINCELIAYCVEWAVEHKDKHRKALQWFLSAGLERGVIDQQAIDAGFKNFVSKLPDKIIDVPMATKHTASLLGPFLADGVVMSDIVTNPPEDLVLMGKADTFAADCLSAVEAAGGDAKKIAESWSGSVKVKLQH